MADKKLRLAVFGLGPRARYLMSLYEQHPNVEVIAGCDRFPRNVEHAQKAIASSDIHYYLTYNAGNQQGFYYLAEAEFDGSVEEFLCSFFE